MSQICFLDDENDECDCEDCMKQESLSDEAEE